MVEHPSGILEATPRPLIRIWMKVLAAAGPLDSLEPRPLCDRGDEAGHAQSGEAKQHRDYRKFRNLLAHAVTGRGTDHCRPAYQSSANAEEASHSADARRAEHDPVEHVQARPGSIRNEIVDTGIRGWVEDSKHEITTRLPRTRRERRANSEESALRQARTGSAANHQTSENGAEKNFSHESTPKLASLPSGEPQSAHGCKRKRGAGGHGGSILNRMEKTAKFKYRIGE